MLKKTITYQDFNGDEVTEDHFFHLSQAELVELEMSKDGGFAETMQKVIADQDGKTIIAEFKKIVLMAYGQRSPDGRRFIKNQQLRDEFESSEAYSTIFMELVTDAESAAEFVKGIIPTGLGETARQLKLDSSENREVDAVSDPAASSGVETITRKEFQEMNQEDMLNATKRIAQGKLKVAEIAK